MNLVADKGRSSLGLQFLILASLLILGGAGCDYFAAHSVNNYLKDIEEIQRESNLALMDLNRYVSSLSGDKRQIEEATGGLEGNLESINNAYERIDSLDVPDDAVPLHEDLLQLYSSGSLFVTDLIAAGKYQLALEPVLDEYGIMSSNFSAALASANDTASLLETLKSYRTSIEQVLDQTKSLAPPKIATNSHDRLLSNLGILRDGIDELIAAIEQQDNEAIQAASEKISSVSAGNEQLEKDMLSDREADINAYNAQILNMTTLMQKIQEDQAVLRDRFETE